jgi:two-component system sensor histidine kinase GlrK
LFGSRAIRYRPRSILRLILISYLVVLTPPVLAIAFAVGYLEVLFSQGRTAVYDSVRAAQNGRALVEQVTAMERSALQSVALGDSVFLQSYLRSREDLLGSLDALHPLVRYPEFARRVESFRDHETSITRRLQDVAMLPTVEDLAAEFDGLRAQAREILDQSSLVIDQEVRSIQHQSEQARRTIIGIAAIQLPLALLSAVLFTLLIGRPLRQLRRAIEALGDGMFTRPIRIQGPRDVAGVGQRLDWLRQRLVDLEEQKAQFLRQVSHELKTPLTAIREGAQLLSDDIAGPLNASQREIMEILSRNALQLQQLIEDMLNFNMARSHRPALNPRPLDLAVLLGGLLQDHKPALLSKGLRLETHLPPLRLVADEGKLRIILDNLLSNAVKFSPRGGVLWVDCVQQGAEIWIDVRDEGPGIPEEEQERIFEAFFQGKAEIAGGSVVKGSGIGLAIAREYARAHGGEIEVRPSIGRGAWMRLRIPGGSVG